MLGSYNQWDVNKRENVLEKQQIFHRLKYSSH
jgi:hypothetical protein